MAPLDVHGFADRVGLDDKATQALLDLPEESQHIVIKLVDSQSCRNPSAVTWTKIKAMQQQPLFMKAELLRQELDDPSYAALQALPPHMQETIVKEVDVVSSRNLSAVVFAKIRSKSASGAGRAPVQSAASSRNFAGDRALDGKVAAMGLDDGALEALDKLSRPERLRVLNEVNLQAARNPSAVVIKHIQELRRGVGIGRGNMPPASARDRSRTPTPANMMALQNASMMLTTPGFASGRPSVMSVNNSARGGMLPGNAMGGRPAIQSKAIGFQPKMQNLVNAAHGLTGGLRLDARATQALSELSAGEAKMIVFLVSQEKCKNPSAVTWTKVKQYRANPTDLKVEYLRKSIDEGSQKALEELPEETQEEILADIDITKIRNPSAVVWSKVKSANGGVVPAAAMTAAAERHGSGGEGVTGATIEQLDERAVEGLSNLPEEDQQRILEELESSTVHNPSAFVWAKVKRLQPRSS